MLQIRKSYLYGILICGAAYVGVRWLISTYMVTNGDENDESEKENKKETNLKRRTGTRSGNGVSWRDDRNTYRSPSLQSLNSNGGDRFTSAESISSSWTTRTCNMDFYDIDNLQFFKIYQEQLARLPEIPMPRNDRTFQVFCESQEEFLAKVSCLRLAFRRILEESENCQFFINGGREILEIFLDYSPDDMRKCLSAYDELLEFVSDENNHDRIASEISERRIPELSFYDLVIDYIILESLDDLDSPPEIVKSIVSNKWVTSRFRQYSCQSAVTAALSLKRKALTHPDGFFAHFYSVLYYLSPTLAWGFLGVHRRDNPKTNEELRDQELKDKCEFLRESLLGLCRDIFSFDRVRYTTYQDLMSDIMDISRERYCELLKGLTLTS